MANKLAIINLLLITLTIVAFLLIYLPCYSENDEKFVNAAAFGDIKGIESKLKNVNDINVKAYEGWTALTKATENRHIEMVIFLLNHGADINKEGAGNFTPIYWAAFNGDVKIVKLLIERGADINHKCAKCRLPIEIARIRGHQEIVEILSALQTTK
jgi:ankyrin repeat protein